MREYVNFAVFAWCCAWWLASIYYFVTNWKKHEKRFGYLHVPVIVFTGIFSPGLVIVETILGIIKRLKRWANI